MSKPTCDDCQNNHIDQLKINQARLWVDHYFLTREVIRDAASNSPCLEVDLGVLYTNQDELGANFARLTGNKHAGQQLAAILREHITIAVAIVVAAIQGQPIEQLYQKWKVNAVQISQIYHKYNRRIRFVTLNHHMQEHLATTLNEAVAIISGNCQESARTGAIALAHINSMANYINSKFY